MSKSKASESALRSTYPRMRHFLGLGIINRKSHQLEQRITQLLDYVSNSNQDFRNTLESRPIEPFLQEFLAPFSEDLLTRALENLILNGFKYGDDNTPVSVAATLQHG